MYAYLGVTGHLYFWQNDRGLLRVTAVTLGMERTPNKSQHTKLTLEKKFLPGAGGIRTRNLSIKSTALYQQIIPAPPFKKVPKLIIRFSLLLFYAKQTSCKDLYLLFFF